MLFLALATTALSFFASCASAAPFDAETGISPLAVRAGAVDVVVPNSDLLVKKAAADITAINAQVNDILAKRDDVVLDAIADITAQVNVIIAKLSVKGIVIADVQVLIPQLVTLIVDLKVKIDAVGTWDSDVVDISVQLNAFISLFLNVFVTLKAELGLTVLASLFADVQVALQACIDVNLDVVVGLDVLLLPLVTVDATVLAALGLSLNIGGVVIGV
jgi:hypothetical protein